MRHLSVNRPACADQPLGCACRLSCSLRATVQFAKLVTVRAPSSVESGCQPPVLSRHRLYLLVCRAGPRACLFVYRISSSSSVVRRAWSPCVPDSSYLSRHRVCLLVTNESSLHACSNVCLSRRHVFLPDGHRCDCLACRVSPSCVPVSSDVSRRRVPLLDCCSVWLLCVPVSSAESVRREPALLAVSVVACASTRSPIVLPSPTCCSTSYSCALWVCAAAYLIAVCLARPSGLVAVCQLVANESGRCTPAWSDLSRRYVYLVVCFVRTCLSRTRRVVCMLLYPSSWVALPLCLSRSGLRYVSSATAQWRSLWS